jgi:DHA1 family inner membrane transport protein
MPIALFALALGGFGIGLTEFGTIGLLPQIGSDFNISAATAGYLVSGYAFSVALGGVLITIAVTKLERKAVLLSLMSLFIAGNLISGLAGTFSIMMVGRVVSALCHGAFFGIGAVVATDLVDITKKARALSIMFTGLTVANVLGVPFGTWIGQQFGWRSTFLAISGIGVAAFIAIVALVPIDKPHDLASGPRSIRQELHSFKQRQVWYSLFVTIFGFGGMFGGFTYIAYTLTRVTHFADSSIPYILFLFGIGVFIGNNIGGRSADKHLKATISGYLGALFVILIIFAQIATNKPAAVISILVMGILGFAPVSAVQMRVMRYASSAPTLASGANIASFNIGNTIGASAGGFLIAQNYGYTSPLWSAAGLTLIALIIFYIADLDEKRVARRTVTS